MKRIKCLWIGSFPPIFIFCQTWPCLQWSRRRKIYPVAKQMLATCRLVDFSTKNFQNFQKLVKNIQIYFAKKMLTIYFLSFFCGIFLLFSCNFPCSFLALFAEWLMLAAAECGRIVARMIPSSHLPSFFLALFHLFLSLFLAFLQFSLLFLQNG